MSPRRRIKRHPEESKQNGSVEGYSRGRFLSPDYLAGFDGSFDTMKLVSRPKYRGAINHLLVTAMGSVLGALVVLFLHAILALDKAGNVHGILDFNFHTSKVILISLGTLCLGFGAATLAYWHSRDSEARALEAIYEDLCRKADAAIEEFEQFDRTIRTRST